MVYDSGELPWTHHCIRLDYIGLRRNRVVRPDCRHLVSHGGVYSEESSTPKCLCVVTDI